MDWPNVLQCKDVDEAWCSFKRMFLEMVDKVAPYKEIRIKQRTEPWINDDILKAIQARNRKYDTFRAQKDEQNWAYKKVRNIVVITL